MTPALDFSAATYSATWLDRLEETVEAAMEDRMRLPLVKIYLVRALQMVRSIMSRRQIASGDERQELQSKIDRMLIVLDKVERLVGHYDEIFVAENFPEAAADATQPSRLAVEAEAPIQPETESNFERQKPTDRQPAVVSLTKLDRAELLATLRLGPNGDGRAPFILVRNKSASAYRLLENRFNVDPSASEMILHSLLAEGVIQIKLRGLPPGGEVRPSIFVVE